MSCLLGTEEEEERWEKEEEEHARQAAMPPTEQTLEESTRVAWETVFSWAGPPPAFVDLTCNNDNDDDS